MREFDTAVKTLRESGGLQFASQLQGQTCTCHMAKYERSQLILSLFEHCFSIHTNFTEVISTLFRYFINFVKYIVDGQRLILLIQKISRN